MGKDSHVAFFMYFIIILIVSFTILEFYFCFITFL
jgi:hypothetical protein